MSLKDHNIDYVMENVGRQTIPFVDSDNIEHELTKQGLSTKVADIRQAAGLQGILQRHSHQHRVAIQRNEHRTQEREEPADADDIIPPVPDLQNDFEPFTDDEKKRSMTTPRRSTTVDHPNTYHPPQGVVERYHQTLFAQLRTIKVQFCQDYNIDP
eukprot:3925694-Amphidinium_carterae.1